tara:strand:- start:2442 stop:2678 length:237 start_codon:yes stop_codon:yes gene_type:complete
MTYTFNDIDKIINFKSWNNRKKLDELFRIDAYLYCNLGITSSYRERTEVKRKSKVIYKAVETIDENIGKPLLFLMDTD